MLTGTFCLGYNRNIEKLKRLANQPFNQGLKVHIMFTRAITANASDAVHKAQCAGTCAAQGYQMNSNSINWSSVDTHKSATFARRDEVVHRDSKGVV